MELSLSTGFYANIVLDGLKAIKPNDDEIQKINELKGSALFYRSLTLYNIVKLFCDHYTWGSEELKEGIPLPLSADVKVKEFKKLKIKSSLPLTMKTMLSESDDGFIKVDGMII